MPSLPERFKRRRHVTELDIPGGGQAQGQGQGQWGESISAGPRLQDGSGAGHGHHRRESSILSLPGTVVDLGHNVKRSVSLRSHRTQGSLGSSSSLGGSRPRHPFASPTTPTDPASLNTPPTPPSHGKLSRSPSQRLHSLRPSQTLPVLNRPEQEDTLPEIPPKTAFDTSGPKTPSAFSGMLAAPGAAFKRRDSDRPSLGGSSNSYARDISSSNGSIAPPPLAPNNPTAIHTHITELSAKRIATITYLQHLHSQPSHPTNGNTNQIHHFSTLSYTPAQLSALPSQHPARAGRRASSYLLLGYSLPALLDLNSSNPLEYLRALHSLLSEFETYQSLAETASTGSGMMGGGSSLSRAKMSAVFKASVNMSLGGRAGGKGRRSSATPDSLASLQHANSDPTASDLGFLDPHQASPAVNLEGTNFTHLLHPHLPFDPDFHTTFQTLCDALIETYENLLRLVEDPSSCSPVVGEAFNKADKLVRKLLVGSVLREFEEHTRAGVKQEVGGVGRLVLGGLV